MGGEVEWNALLQVREYVRSALSRRISSTTWARQDTSRTATPEEGLVPFVGMIPLPYD